MTVRDIAKIAGVSPTTVSLVLNDKAPNISLETRQRILAIAEKENYRPNMIAVSLATNRTNTLGVIVPDLANLFYATMVSGIENYAQRKDQSLLLCNCSDSIPKCLNLISTLQDRCIDGLILIPPATVNEEGNYLTMTKRLHSFPKPYILLERAIHNLYHDFVTSDNKLGGYIATEHLLKLGHRSIGCITGPLSEYGAMRRLQGYQEALEEYDVPYNPQLIYQGDFHSESGKAGAQTLLPKGITALFCCNDMMAQGALLMAEKMHVDVPRQLSVVGYDNNPIADILRVPLTTVAQPVETMGKNACEILLRKIKNKDAPQQDYYFSPVLVERESTAAVGQGQKRPVQ